MTYRLIREEKNPLVGLGVEYRGGGQGGELVKGRGEDGEEKRGRERKKN